MAAMGPEDYRGEVCYRCRRAGEILGVALPDYVRLARKDHDELEGLLATLQLLVEEAPPAVDDHQFAYSTPMIERPPSAPRTARPESARRSPAHGPSQQASVGMEFREHMAPRAETARSFSSIRRASLVVFSFASPNPPSRLRHHSYPPPPPPQRFILLCTICITPAAPYLSSIEGPPTARRPLHRHDPADGGPPPPARAVPNLVLTAAMGPAQERVRSLLILRTPIHIHA
jgi:hypothetical protein